MQTKFLTAFIGLTAYIVTFFPVLADEVCIYAGQAYSIGSTICECPSVSNVSLGLATGGGGKITIQRLECKYSRSIDLPTHWSKTDRPCFEGEGATSSGAVEFFERNLKQFCPDPNGTTSGDLLINMLHKSGSGTPIEESATDEQLSTVIKQLCKRYVKAPAFCATLD
ncbi:MAG: hypothetical protein HWD84_11185 [Flavobacteriaceae bacterium]|nr:hypothetical protein [Flavobacteriaceae bacterium]